MDKSPIITQLLPFDHIKSTGRIKETPITTITEGILIDGLYVCEKISAKEIQLTIKELPQATATSF